MGTEDSQSPEIRNIIASYLACSLFSVCSHVTERSMWRGTQDACCPVMCDKRPQVEGRQETRLAPSSKPIQRPASLPESLVPPR